MPLYDGNPNNNTIYGSSGNDDIFGRGGHDFLSGGLGNDRIYGGSGDDDLVGGAGFNTLYGGVGSDWFITSSRNTSYFSDDFIGDFEFGLDKIDLRNWGVSDFSQVRALLRTDSYGDATLDAYFGGIGHRITIDRVAVTQLIATDFIYDTGGGRTTNGTNYADVLFGSRGADAISGLNGDDVILAGIGNDRVNGGAGNDRITGGAGWDIMTGGANNDTFVFTLASDSAVGTYRDRITDFELDRDRIDLFQIDANDIAGGNQAFTFRGTGAFTAAGQINYYYANGDTIISGNTDTDVAPEFQIALTGIKALIASDFIV